MEFSPSWNSLSQHPVAKWLREGKFGIYTHWGVYSVPACGPNVSWYPCFMYRPGTQQYSYHCRNYGNPDKFGYKDFIPMLTGERFDPDEWAELFAAAGARFAGPVAEHHDGFSMWKSDINEWNSYNMGPRRDVAGELAKAIRAKGMKFMAALHHAEQWYFYPHWIKEFDTADPGYQGLYGAAHNTEWASMRTDDPNWQAPEGMDVWASQNKPSFSFLDTWLAKGMEVVDKLSPDLIWFDFGLGFVPESYKQQLIAYYYNQAIARGQDPVVTYKFDNLPVNCGLIDIELGRYDKLKNMPWLTDTTVDDGEAWGYMKNAEYKSPRTVVHYLIDNVSKNGFLLLNIGPDPTGWIPDEAKEILSGIGNWLAVNGEAIYGTVPWSVYGAGPTQLEKSGYFNESKTPVYTSGDVRFTVKDNALYAVFLGWPEKEAVIEKMPESFRPEEVTSLSMLGSEEKIDWKMEGSRLMMSCPKSKPCNYAFTYKIERRFYSYRGSQSP